MPLPSPLPSDKLRDLCSQGRWDLAIDLLRQYDVNAAADAVIALPFEEQRALFRKLPVDYAAALVGCFPYFHAYVLLHSRPPTEMHAIVEGMNPTERDNFLDALPEEAWQSLMATLAATHAADARPAGGATEVTGAAEPILPPQAPAPIIEARKIEKSYQQPDGPEIQVIAPIDLDIEPDTILAVLGPSGSGKSTLLRMLTGLLPPTAGEVLWHGVPVTGCTPNVAIVFQSFALFPWLTVLENVEAPLLARGLTVDERRSRALHAIASVGLANFETAYPKELSGGMKQRVGFARALAVEPEVLFMDEPFSALDVLTAENLRGELMELWLAHKIPTRSIFLVTHNIEEAVLLADRIVVLGRNPATIRADLRLPLKRPRDRKSAAFLLYVDYIYKVITQPQVEVAPPRVPAGGSARPVPQMLPHSRPGSVSGLLELLVDRGGEEDMYHIAEDLLLEIDDLLPIIETATLLGFATVREGDVVITEHGRRFAEADISTRKMLFREAALARVALLQQMKAALERKSDHKMPLEFFRDILDEHFTAEDVQRQVETALNWGRYAEIFKYDSEADELSLYEPEAPAKVPATPVESNPKS
ncbi:MAG: AAA-associated domain-containing protein [Candidatus Acidiferrales bacterium]|jgi:NitT/TauT family transport system ATP-binding protein